MNPDQTLSFSFHFREPGSHIQGPLRHATGRSQDGLVLIACSPQGLCAVFLGDSPEALVAELPKAFPGLELQHDPQGLQTMLEQVIALADQKPCHGRLALDLAGTAFQQDVWRALCTIPAGKTLSYTQLAAEVGRPAAVRAVASACGANQVAVVIPCHRAVRSDGSISGYRWGRQRKKALLEREAEIQPALPI